MDDKNDIEIASISAVLKVGNKKRVYAFRSNATSMGRKRAPKANSRTNLEYAGHKRVDIALLPGSHAIVTTLSKKLQQAPTTPGAFAILSTPTQAAIRGISRTVFGTDIDRAPLVNDVQESAEARRAELNELGYIPGRTPCSTIDCNDRSLWEILATSPAAADIEAVVRQNQQQKAQLNALTETLDEVDPYIGELEDRLKMIARIAGTLPPELQSSLGKWFANELLTRPIDAYPSNAHPMRTQEGSKEPTDAVETKGAHYVRTARTAANVPVTARTQNEGGLR